MTDPIKAEPVAWMYEYGGGTIACTAIQYEPAVLRALGYTETPLYTHAQLEALQQRVREMEEASHMAMLELGSHGPCPACCNAHSTLRNALTKPEGLK